ncbi:MAG: tyrosine-type recombinase/integrase [Planktothrix sp.]
MGKYQWLAVKIQITKYGNFYHARLSARLERKTIGLGGDELTALNIAKILDDTITDCVRSGNPVEIEKLKILAKEILYAEKLKNSPRIASSGDGELVDLYKRYVSFHLSTQAWKEGYYISNIKGIESLLRKSPYQLLSEKSDFINWIFSDKNRTPQTSKRHLMLVVAAIDWCSKQGIIPRNIGIEWRDGLNSISIKKQKQTSDGETESIDIFTIEEVYKILNAFKDEDFSRYEGKHLQYYPYIYFLWLTGCRPSEAIALKWNNTNLTKNLIKFCETERSANGKICKQEGTKTQDYRYFPINDELRKLLILLPKNGNYVFTNLKGEPIRQHAFLKPWKTVLTGLGIRPRRPYQLRHTMISHHANNDYPLHKLASLIGNSEAIIKSHYLRLDIERMALPGVIRN